MLFQDLNLGSSFILPRASNKVFTKIAPFVFKDVTYNTVTNRRCLSQTSDDAEVIETDEYGSPIVRYKPYTYLNLPTRLFDQILVHKTSKRTFILHSMYKNNLCIMDAIKRLGIYVSYETLLNDYVLLYNDTTFPLGVAIDERTQS